MVHYFKNLLIIFFLREDSRLKVRKPHIPFWMQKTKMQLYELVKDLKTIDEFEHDVCIRSEEFGGLFDEDVVALLLVDKLGRNNQSLTNIADVKADLECTVVGTISMMYPEKTFKRKNGAAGKVMNFDLRDETGSCRLVVWNDDIEQAKQLKQGTKVKIINGYTKQGFSGLEIHLGRWGLLEIEPQDEIKTPIRTVSESSDRIIGVLLKKEPTRAFFRDNGEFGFVTTITIQEGTQEKKLTLWGQSVKEIQQFKINDTVDIVGVSSKQVNGKIEIHVNDNSIIKRSC